MGRYSWSTLISPNMISATGYNHDPRRPRKLLLNKKEIRRLDSRVREQGYTIVPLRMYIVRGYAKVEIGLAKGKKLWDKRRDIAERQARREMERAAKGRY